MLPFGLADGARPVVAGVTPTVVVRGTRCPVLAVSLEYTTIDLTDIDGAAVGDPVTLVGGDSGISLEEWAGWWAGTPSLSYTHPASQCTQHTRSHYASASLQRSDRRLRPRYGCDALEMLCSISGRLPVCQA